MNRLVISASILKQAWRGLCQGTERTIRISLGVSVLDGERTWLTSSYIAPSSDPVVHISLSHDPTAFLRSLTASQPSSAGCRPQLFLILGSGASRGLLALGQVNGASLDVHEIRLVGLPMPVSRNEGQESSSQLESSSSKEQGVASIGEGIEAMKSAIFGLGSEGKTLARALAYHQPPNIDLISLELITKNDLQQPEYERAALGEPKAVALARYLGHASRSGLNIRGGKDVAGSPFCAPIAKNSDILISCADNFRECMAICLMGAALLKPVLALNIARSEENGDAVSVADVRLTLPGTCLYCLDGIPHVDSSQRLQKPSGKRGRPGGVHRRLVDPICMSASGLALHLLEDMVAGRLHESVWLRLEFDEGGACSITKPSLHRAGPCPICRRTGKGDTALRELDQVIGEINASRIPRIF